MSFILSYSNWKDDNRQLLEDLSNRTVYLLYSGGKDSSLTLDYILRASKDFGFKFGAHAGGFPVHRYTQEEKNRLGTYWSNRGVNILWYDMGETDDYIKYAPNPCLPCQELRKKMLKTILSKTIDDWGNLVLIPCYSLWDIVSYSVEHLLGYIYVSDKKEHELEGIMRFKETAQRFYPILKMKEGYSVFRPLIKYNGNDILREIEIKGIPILSIPCEYKGFRPKRIFETYYENLGIRFDYTKVLDFAKKCLNLPEPSEYNSITKEEYLTKLF